MANNAKQQIKNNMQAALTSLMAIFNVHLHDEKAKFEKGLKAIEISYKREIDAQSRRIRSLEEKLNERRLGQSQVSCVDAGMFLMIFVTQLLQAFGQDFAVLFFAALILVLLIVRVVLGRKIVREERVTSQDIENISGEIAQTRSETMDKLEM